MRLKKRNSTTSFTLVLNKSEIKALGKMKMDLEYSTDRFNRRIGRLEGNAEDIDILVAILTGITTAR